MKHILITTIAAVLLVGCGPSTRDISIWEAAGDGNIEAVKQLLANGADVNAKDGDGATPLHYATDREIAELLIANGANVNAKDGDGETPLDLTNTEIADLLREHGGKHGVINGAAADGDIEAVKKFLAVGTDVNTKDGWEWTPLHYAAIRGHKEIAELLIAKGANVNAKNNVGDTPLDLATHLSNPNASPEIADLIRKQGAKTGEVLKVEGTSFNQMPEIDLSSFTEEQQATILVRANKENCDCGCKMTVAECRNDDTSCRTSVRLAKAIVEEVTGEKAKNESKAKGAKTGEELKAEGK